MKQLATRSGHLKGIERKVRGKEAAADAESVTWYKSAADRKFSQLASMGKKGPGDSQDFQLHKGLILKPISITEQHAHAAVRLCCLMTVMKCNCDHVQCLR